MKRKVKQLSLTGELIEVHKSMTAAAKKSKVNIGHICKCCMGFGKSAGGFIWKYDETEFYKGDHDLDKLLLLEDPLLNQVINTSKI